jgi:hypothetical protein
MKNVVRYTLSICAMVFVGLGIALLFSMGRVINFDSYSAFGWLMFATWVAIWICIGHLMAEAENVTHKSEEGPREGVYYACEYGKFVAQTRRSTTNIVINTAHAQRLIDEGWENKCDLTHSDISEKLMQAQL